MEDLGIDGRIIFKRILEKGVVLVWNGFVCLRLRARGGGLGSGPVFSTEAGEFVYLSYYKLLKECSPSSEVVVEHPVLSDFL